MKQSLLLGLLFAALAAPASAQTVGTLLPARNATAAARATSVSAVLSAAPVAGATLVVHSTQAGGKKAGTLRVVGNTLGLSPAVGFKAGETLTATLNNGPGLRHVWQFTAAAQPSSGFFKYKSLASPGQAGLVSASVLGDVDGDNDLDLLVISQPNSPTTTSQALTLWLNNGVGVLSAGPALPPPTSYISATQVRMADFDGDGDLDILYRDYTNTSLRLLRNTGTGTFVDQAQLLPTRPNGYTEALSCGDVDGDGDVDVLLSTGTITGTGPQVEVGFNTGTGQFVFASTQPANAFGSSDLMLGDLDSDGDLDLVSVGRQEEKISVSFNDGQGIFSGTQQLSVAALNKIALADMDGNGSLDLAILRTLPVNQNGTVHVIFNNGQGTFSGGGSLALATGLYPSDLKIADLEGDGDLDMFVTNYFGAGVQIYVNQGAGYFTNRSFGTGGHPQHLALGDVDNDHDVDVVVTDELNGVAASYLNGEGTALASQPPGSAPSVGVYPVPAHAGDTWQLPLPQPETGIATLRTLLGQPLRQHRFAGASAEMPVGGLAPGSYLLTVQLAAQAPLTYRVVVE